MYPYYCTVKVRGQRKTRKTEASFNDRLDNGLTRKTTTTKRKRKTTKKDEKIDPVCKRKSKTLDKFCRLTKGYRDCKKWKTVMVLKCRMMQKCRIKTSVGFSQCMSLDTQSNERYSSVDDCFNKN